MSCQQRKLEKPRDRLSVRPRLRYHGSPSYLGPGRSWERVTALQVGERLFESASRKRRASGQCSMQRSTFTVRMHHKLNMFADAWSYDAVDCAPTLSVIRHAPVTRINIFHTRRVCLHVLCCYVNQVRFISLTAPCAPVSSGTPVLIMWTYIRQPIRNEMLLLL